MIQGTVVLQIHHRVARGNADTLLAAAWYALCATVAFGVTAAALVWLSPLAGSIHTVRVAPGTTALQTAGAAVPLPLAYVGFGMTRVYLTALPAAFLLAGLLGGALLDRGGNTVATMAGIAAAATLTVVTGCPCGSGAATPLVLEAL